MSSFSDLQSYFQQYIFQDDLSIADHVTGTKKVSKETILYVNRMMTKQKIDVTMATHLRHEMKALLPSFLFHHLGREMNSYRFIETLIAE